MFKSLHDRRGGVKERIKYRQRTSAAGG